MALEPFMRWRGSSTNPCSFKITSFATLDLKRNSSPSASPPVRTFTLTSASSPKKIGTLLMLYVTSSPPLRSKN
ncbi:hypothetical protein TorRG33x02_001320 [Trema orientale]|uniref:Uncharacterized protein n=1 Tax=Trema orientale TaxID=63057 RepID=A0A2P5G194_TREOI|nr:hypothetical protein TorRG33x02_001320 [Trema orientale]